MKHTVRMRGRLAPAPTPGCFSPEHPAWARGLNGGAELSLSMIFAGVGCSAFAAGARVTLAPGIIDVMGRQIRIRGFFVKHRVIRFAMLTGLDGFLGIDLARGVAAVGGRFLDLVL